LEETQKEKASGLEMEDLATLLDEDQAEKKGPAGKKEARASDAPLDLEDLDLELELEEPEHKSS
jgi:hypothetical protein